MYTAPTYLPVPVFTIRGFRYGWVESTWRWYSPFPGYLTSLTPNSRQSKAFAVTTYLHGSQGGSTGSKTTVPGVITDGTSPLCYKFMGLRCKGGTIIAALRFLGLIWGATASLPGDVSPHVSGKGRSPGPNGHKTAKQSFRGLI
jgi:hypothetical protein